MRLGHQIMQARKKAGMTQAALARKTGTAQSNISRLERGDYNPSLGFLQKIAKAIGAKIKIQFG